MKRLYLTLFICLSWAIGILQAQSLEKNIEDRLREFFTNYETSYANIGKSRLDKFVVDHDKKRLDIYANKNFGYQPFTEENTTAIYRSLKQTWYRTPSAPRRKTKAANTGKSTTKEIRG